MGLTRSFAFTRLSVARRLKLRVPPVGLRPQRPLRLLHQQLLVHLAE
jgi:hypothetical protein